MIVVKYILFLSEWSNGVNGSDGFGSKVGGVLVGMFCVVLIVSKYLELEEIVFDKERYGSNVD